MSITLNGHRWWLVDRSPKEDRKAGGRLHICSWCGQKVTVTLGVTDPKPELRKASAVRCDKSDKPNTPSALAASAEWKFDPTDCDTA